MKPTAFAQTIIAITQAFIAAAPLHDAFAIESSLRDSVKASARPATNYSRLQCNSSLIRQTRQEIRDGLEVTSAAKAGLRSLLAIAKRLNYITTQTIAEVLSDDERNALNAEAQELAKEFVRVRNSTAIHGVSLLSDDATSLVFQIGLTNDASSELKMNLRNTVASSLTTVEDGTFRNGTTSETNLGNVTGGVLNDFDQDGKVDVILTTNSGSGLKLKLGNGDGTFRPAKDLSTGGSLVQALTIGDVNGDGITDLVYNNGESDAVKRGNGDGTFTAEKIVRSASGGNQIVLSDVDHDGKLDIIEASSGSNGVEVSRGNGDGTFRAPLVHPANGPLTDLALADMNVDGIEDIVATRSNPGAVVIFLGQGDGTYRNGRVFADSIHSSTIGVGDLNGDGRIDVLTSDHNGGGINLHHGNGDGTLRAPLPLTSTTEDNGDFLVTDLDNDGFVDLALGDSGDLAVAIGVANNSVKPKVTYQGPSTQSGRLIRGDVNGDGLQDILFGTRADGSLQVFLSNGATHASSLLSFSFATIVDSAHSLSRVYQLQQNLYDLRSRFLGYERQLRIARLQVESTAQWCKWHGRRNGGER